MHCWPSSYSSISISLDSSDSCSDSSISCVTTSDPTCDGDGASSSNSRAALCFTVLQSLLRVPLVL
jgi:hypothetical protein